MQSPLRRMAGAALVIGAAGAVAAVLLRPVAADPQEDTDGLPPPVKRQIDFRRDVLPLLSARCAQCHTGKAARAEFHIDTRETMLKGGESGEVVSPGHSDESYLIDLVAGMEPDRVMPARGPRLSAEQVGILRAWIDQGLKWEAGYDIAAARRAAIRPRRPTVPAPDAAAGLTNPVDRILKPYYQKHGVAPADPVSDRTFARRVNLDLVGLLPSPEQLEAFTGDKRPDKRAALVQSLLENREAYAVHWLTFWNDALRNAYRGTGYIDGGRRQITGWLYQALYENKPYDQFVRELVDPAPESAGFIGGIKWRGVVNASQRREMQAAQNVAQVFLGTNLKCASCHDSFINEWNLTDSYGLAAVFADGPMEIHRCNKPTGKMAAPAFIYPSLGTIDPAAPKEQRMRQLAGILTSPDDGRLARTIVNRLWAQLFGRGLIEPVDDMDREPFCGDLLDFLGADLQDHGYDLKHTLALLCTSRAYQRQAIGAPPPGQTQFVFRGPLVRRMSAEQFADAVSTVTGVWQQATPQMTRGGGGPGGQLAAVRAAMRKHQAAALGTQLGVRPRIRAALADADPLTRALGRPNRDQVVTRRDSVATTLQGMELTNGPTLDGILRRGAEQWLARSSGDSGKLTDGLFLAALGRRPNAAERAVALELLGPKPSRQRVQDLLWILCMLPEFQLIY